MKFIRRFFSKLFGTSPTPGVQTNPFEGLVDTIYSDEGRPLPHDEEKYFEKLERELNVPNQITSVERKNLATLLRQSGTLYHMTYLSWQKRNPDKTEADFDALSFEEKDKFMRSRGYHV